MNSTLQGKFENSMYRKTLSYILKSFNRSRVSVLRSNMKNNHLEIVFLQSKSFLAIHRDIKMIHLYSLKSLYFLRLHFVVCNHSSMFRCSLWFLKKRTGSFFICIITILLVLVMGRKTARALIIKENLQFLASYKTSIYFCLETSSLRTNLWTTKYNSKMIN